VTRPPITHKCQVLAAGTDKVLARLRDEGALRPDVETVQVCRLVGGVAAVADQGGLGETAVQPLLEVVADGVLQPR
jgi:Transcriptional regulator SbtR-like, C-terminal domain